MSQRNSPEQTRRLRVVIAEVEAAFPNHDFAPERAQLEAGTLTIHDLHLATLRGIRAGGATVGYPEGLALAPLLDEAMPGEDWDDKMARAQRGCGPRLAPGPALLMDDEGVDPRENRR